MYIELRRASGKRRALALGAVLLVAVAGWLALEPGPAPPPPVALRPQPAPLPAAAMPPAAVARPAGAELAEAVSRVAQLWQRGPLRGTQLDGDWGQWVDGRLQPSRSLRLRFDYLLAGLGEVGVADLRVWIAQQVRADLGNAAVDQVLAVWDRYLLALQAASGIRRDPAHAEGWQQASSQLGLQRRNALGPAWAHAFFAEEERADEAFLTRRQLPRAVDEAGRAEASSADPGTLLEPAASSLTTAQRAARDAQRVAAFGAEAAERLRADEAAQVAWAQQLAAVRERLAAIAADPQLSAPQRQQAQEAEITRQYSGTALIRARALLAEPP